MIGARSGLVLQYAPVLRGEKIRHILVSIVVLALTAPLSACDDTSEEPTDPGLPTAQILDPAAPTTITVGGTVIFEGRGGGGFRPPSTNGTLAIRRLPPSFSSARTRRRTTTRVSSPSLSPRPTPPGASAPTVLRSRLSRRLDGRPAVGYIGLAMRTQYDKNPRDLRATAAGPASALSV